MKILVDMNLPPRWIRFLEEAGFEGAHWSQVGASDAPDQEIMAFAAAQDFIVTYARPRFQRHPRRD
jgi:predicted nuclease of predicted toxin-antitoxin system